MEPENRTIKIEQIKEDDTLICKLTGWLDPNTTPELEQAVDLHGVKTLIFDMENVEYVFSAGLRIFLFFEKEMKGKGGVMKLVKTSEFVKSIFELVGFDEILDNGQ